MGTGFYISSSFHELVHLAFNFWIRGCCIWAPNNQKRTQEGQSHYNHVKEPSGANVWVKTQIKNNWNLWQIPKTRLSLHLLSMQQRERGFGNAIGGWLCAGEFRTLGIGQLMKVDESWWKLMKVDESWWKLKWMKIDIETSLFWWESPKKSWTLYLFHLFSSIFSMIDLSLACHPLKSWRIPWTH